MNTITAPAHESAARQPIRPAVVPEYYGSDGQPRPIGARDVALTAPKAAELAAQLKASPWALDQHNPPGPLQTKRVNEHLKRLRWMAGESVELEGVTDRPGKLSEFTTRLLLDAADLWPEPLAVMLAVQRKFGGTISKTNAAAIAAELEQGLAGIDQQTKPIRDVRNTPEQEQQRQEARERIQREHEKRSKVEAEQRAAAAAVRPAWASRAIVAELEEDDSDTMTDYFAVKTRRTILIGWLRGEREDFRQLRAAAARYPETAHLAEAPKDAEHRENYSMGAGTYLKAGARYSSGWAVRTTQRTAFDEIADCAKEPAATAPTAAATAPAGWAVRESTNKKGPFYLVHGPRIERDGWERLCESARASGGWYSRAWGDSPAGWGFHTEAEAREWLGKIGQGAG